MSTIRRSTIISASSIREVFVSTRLELHDPLLLLLGSLLLVVVHLFAVPLQIVFPHCPVFSKLSPTNNSFNSRLLANIVPNIKLHLTACLSWLPLFTASHLFGDIALLVSFFCSLGGTDGLSTCPSCFCISFHRHLLLELCVSFVFRRSSGGGGPSLDVFFVSCSCPPSSSVTDTGVMISRAAQCCFIVQGAHPFADSWSLNEILLRHPSFSPSAVGESVLSLVVTAQPSCHELQPHRILQSSGSTPVPYNFAAPRLPSSRHCPPCIRVPNLHF